MKDLRAKDKSLFQIKAGDAEEALLRVQSALSFLWEESERSMHDKVAGDFDYEELIAALLHAEAVLIDVNRTS